MDLKKIIKELGTFNEKRYFFELFVVILIIIIFSVFNGTRTVEKEVKINLNEFLKENELYLTKKNYYMALDEEITLDFKNPKNLEYEIIVDNKDLVEIDNSKIKAINIGSTKYFIRINNIDCFTGEIFVVKGISVRPNNFNKSKKYITCNEFSDDENKIIDDALNDKINSVGKKTRAGVVEAARFLTLDFSYRIAYFYENGRLNNYGDKNHVDGEGRYYHEGLYLSKEKYNFIEKSFTGPGAWGCKITQYQDAPQYKFVPRVKYPNGFDCSGFISWVLLNGGFDVKDSGAGNNPKRDDDLYDLGEKKNITNELLNSGNVKVGDLIAYQGHMAIIAGIDSDNNYYVAESLPQFKGVVLNKYNKTKLKATFSHIMLMDSEYENDGNLTNMWY